MVHEYCTGAGDHDDPTCATGSREWARVLLVDPYTDERDMYAEYLLRSGMVAIGCDNTSDAWTAAPAADVVVTDVFVPGPFDGLELVRRLRHNLRTSTKLLIVLTGCAWTTDKESAQAAGCDMYLPKPCLPDILLAEITRLLTRRPAGPKRDR